MLGGRRYDVLRETLDLLEAEDEEENEALLCRVSGGTPPVQAEPLERDAGLSPVARSASTSPTRART